MIYLNWSTRIRITVKKLSGGTTINIGPHKYDSGIMSFYVTESQPCRQVCTVCRSEKSTYINSNYAFDAMTCAFWDPLDNKFNVDENCLNSNKRGTFCETKWSNNLLTITYKNTVSAITESKRSRIFEWWLAYPRFVTLRRNCCYSWLLPKIT